MKAYQITQWGQPLEEREVEIPKTKGTEVLLKVTPVGFATRIFTSGMDSLTWVVEKK